MAGHANPNRTAVGVGIASLLLLHSQGMAFCLVQALTIVTHAAAEFTEDSGAKNEARSDTLQSASASVHEWDSTCAAYRSINVRFPAVNAQAKYNLVPMVQYAPHHGWSCKASERVFELEEYPSFFRSVVTILLGDKDDATHPGDANELHKHKDKHVFFAFNPCRLLPHSCHGSRGRLFKFAAKLKDPHDPSEEVDRLLAELLKLPPPSSDADATRDDEEADRTECLQNVLPTNTTLLYAHNHESLQQHPNSNGLGGLWSEPDISDDPTPWEPLDPNDPYKGLQSNMRHTHVFCPDSFMHIHVTLKCAKGGSPNAADTDFTRFDSCEHVNPCLFKMQITTTAACPLAVSHSAVTATPADLTASTTAGAAAPGSVLGEKADEAMASGANSGQKEKQKQSRQQDGGSLRVKEGFQGMPSFPQRFVFTGSSSAQEQPETVKPGPWYFGTFWHHVSSLLFLALRVALCGLIFAWIFYAVRDWTQTKMQYEPLPEERAATEVATAANLNSYDSCAKALAEASDMGVSDHSTACELASTFKKPSGAVEPGGGQSDQHVPRRNLRGLYSSPGRRFVSVWLPYALDAAANQARALTAAAHGVCGRVASTFAGGRHPEREFSKSCGGNPGVCWDWTDALDFQDGEVLPQAAAGGLGLSGYERF